MNPEEREEVSRDLGSLSIPFTADAGGYRHGSWGSKRLVETNSCATILWSNLGTVLLQSSKNLGIWFVSFKQWEAIATFVPLDPPSKSHKTCNAVFIVEGRLQVGFMDFGFFGGGWGGWLRERERERVLHLCGSCTG